MNYAAYKKARDKAWDILIKCSIKSLPVSVKEICKHFHIPYFSYQRTDLLNEWNLLWHTKDTDGFTFYSEGQRVIFYNHKCNIGRIRFTIAHEIGHIVLKHQMEGDAHAAFTLINREPSLNDSWQEQEANVFASRLLAPAVILHALNAVNTVDIAKLCNISLQSAAFRAERMRKLNERDLFGTELKELFVLEQFQDYIHEQQKQGE